MKRNSKSWMIALVIPVAYALFMRIVFDLHLFRDFIVVMSIGFILAVPFGIGYSPVWEGSSPAGAS